MPQAIIRTAPARATSRGSEVRTFRQPSFKVAARRLRIVAQHPLRRGARGTHQVFIAREVGEAQQRHAALARAEKLTGAAQQQILAGDLEPIPILVDDPQPRPILPRN